MNILKIKESQIQTAISRAQDNFNNGLNCAEASYEAYIFSGMIDMPGETVALATGFGGGAGMTGNQCGILTGCMMALGAHHGRRDPFSLDEEVRKTSLHQVNMRAFNGLCNFFIDSFGSALCRNICEKNGGYLAPERKKACTDMIPEMIKKTAEYMNMSEDEVKDLPYFDNMAGYK